MNFLKILVTNYYLCWAIILVLLIINIILVITCINLKKRKQIKDDFCEIEMNSNIDDIDPKKESALNNIIDQMQKDIELKPEQVVANFEEEQEKNAIISYQELLDCVKNKKIQVIEDDQGDIDFVKQLENETKQEPIMTVKNEVKSKSHLDVIDDLNDSNDSKRFTSSEIISPVFGRMSNPKYPKMENYSNTNSLKLGENTMDLEPISEEIKKNEDFLKNLVEFRNNL